MLERMTLPYSSNTNEIRMPVRMAAFPARDRDAFKANWIKILGYETITKLG